MSSHATAETKPAKGVDTEKKRPKQSTGARVFGSICAIALLVGLIIAVYAVVMAKRAGDERAVEMATHLAFKEITVRLADGSAAREGPAPLSVVVRPVYQVKDPTGAPWAYRWDFGDGSSADVEAPLVHTYKRGGTYAISLTVHSVDKGWSATASTQVVVTGGVPDGPAPDKKTFMDHLREQSRGLPGITKPLNLEKILGIPDSKPEKPAVPDGEVIRLGPGEVWTNSVEIKKGYQSSWFTPTMTAGVWTPVAEGPGVQKFNRFGSTGLALFQRFTETSDEVIPPGGLVVKFVPKNK